MQKTALIQEKAEELGFDFMGVTPARRAPHAPAFENWLDQGFQGTMAWLGKDPERRADPRKVLEGTQSVLSLGVSYFVQDPPEHLWNDPSRGRIARYAWGPDYHDILGPMLSDLAGFLRSEFPGCRTRYYVDTGPVLEHEMAWQGGQGFIGKNSLFIHPGFGSLVFLGEILLSEELEPDEATGGQGARWQPGGQGREGTCGNCRRCLDNCPTGAFAAPYVVDSRRCISYLTIELKGSIPEELRPLLGNQVYGCDLCQTVCPWVKRFSKPGHQRFLSFDPATCIPELADLLSLDDEGFRTRFRGRALRRSKRRGLLRNACVAAGNAHEPSLLPALQAAARDPEELIREHAQWAIREIEKFRG